MTVHDLDDALIARAFDAEGWDWGHTTSDEIASAFDIGNFVVTVTGLEDEILVVTGQLAAQFPGELAERVDDVLDDWHRSRPWPTCLRSEPDETGRITVRTEVAGYFPFGLSLDQARTQLRCAVGSTSALVDRLRAELGTELR